MSARSLGLFWAVVCCPLIGWAAVLLGHEAIPGGWEVPGALLLMGVLPAVAAGLVNGVLRGEEAGIRAGLLAAAVCWGGFFFVVLWVALTYEPW